VAMALVCGCQLAASSGQDDTYSGQARFQIERLQHPHEMADACQALDSLARSRQSNRHVLSCVGRPLRAALRRHMAAPCIALFGEAGATPQEMEELLQRARRDARPDCFVAAVLGTKKRTARRLAQASVLALMTGYAQARAFRLARKQTRSVCRALRRIRANRNNDVNRYLQKLGYPESERAGVTADAARRVAALLGCAVFDRDGAGHSALTARRAAQAIEDALLDASCPAPTDEAGRFRLRRLLRKAGLMAPVTAIAPLQRLSNLCGASWRPLLVSTRQRLALVARCRNQSKCYEDEARLPSSHVRDRATIELARRANNRACPFLWTLPERQRATLLNQLHCVRPHVVPPTGP